MTKIFLCEQYSKEWLDLRRGVPTASEFNRILTPKTGELSSQSKKYISELIGDKFRSDYGETEGPDTPDIRRGKEYEAEARCYYEFHTNSTVNKVGFCLDDDGRFGCSPDGLIGEDGGLEVKNPKYSTHAEWFQDWKKDKVMPAEHKAQAHGSLIVTGRKWWDFMSYYPGLPPLIFRVTPDEYTEKLRMALNSFWDKYQEALSLFSKVQV